jgi:hypothetical protein
VTNAERMATPTPTKQKDLKLRNTQLRKNNIGIEINDAPNRVNYTKTPNLYSGKQVRPFGSGKGVPTPTQQAYRASARPGMKSYKSNKVLNKQNSNE